MPAPDRLDPHPPPRCRPPRRLPLPLPSPPLTASPARPRPRAPCRRLAGPAWCSELLPEGRRARINPARNSQLYVKDLEWGDSEVTGVEPGKRIGF
jgi:hypothetical protein